VSEPPVHAEIAPLGWLLGTWAGEGHGHYPTIADFDYGEEVVFAHIGKPFLTYRQRTWALDDGRPLHAEAGYWRLKGDMVELVVSHPTGIAEIEIGPLREDTGDANTAPGVLRIIDLASVAVTATPSAKEVTAVSRQFRAHGDRLEYHLEMAAVGHPLQGHLDATLIRA
jgi:hypothetical protein